MKGLQKKQFELLSEKYGVIISYCKLIDKCEGDPTPEQLKVLTVQMAHLKKKMPPNLVITSVRKYGYMMLKGTTQKR